jgi:hypothetical protein
MAWCKLHTDILGDPKLLRAARQGMQGLVFTPWLIAFAKLSDDDGRLTIGGSAAEPVDIAPKIPNATDEDIRIAMESLERIGVLVRDRSNRLRFATWKQRSGTKPSDSREAVADRVRKSRNRKKQSVNSDDVTPPVSPGNALHNSPENGAHVTPPKQGHVTGQTLQKTGNVRASDNGNGHSDNDLDHDVTPRIATEKKRGEKKRGEESAHTPARELPRRQSAGKPQPHSAGRVLAQIKALAQDRIVPGQENGRYIPRAKVEQLGPDIVAAYDAIGGADAVLKTPGEKWSFLVRDFQRALADSPEPVGAAP